MAHWLKCMSLISDNGQTCFWEKIWKIKTISWTQFEQDFIRKPYLVFRGWSVENTPYIFYWVVSDAHIPSLLHHLLIHHKIASSQQENVDTEKIIVFGNVCKVSRPLNIIYSFSPSQSACEWQLRENKIDLCDRRDQQPTHQSNHILHRDDQSGSPFISPTSDLNVHDMILSVQCLLAQSNYTSTRSLGAPAGPDFYLVAPQAFWIHLLRSLGAQAKWYFSVINGQVHYSS